MTQVNRFDGGINTRLDARKLQPEQAVVLENADVSQGVLTPTKSHVTIVDGHIHNRIVQTDLDNPQSTETFVDLSFDGRPIQTPNGWLYTRDGDSYILPYNQTHPCLLYTSPSPRDWTRSRMPSSA